MILRQATNEDYKYVWYAIRPKNISYITPALITHDYMWNKLYVVKEEDKILATVSLVKEPNYGYTAVKRLCILNKRNCGKGIARFALRELQKVVNDRIGATPWEDNVVMRNLLESEGFVLQYIFNEKWCFYVKE